MITMAMMDFKVYCLSYAFYKIITYCCTGLEISASCDAMLEEEEPRTMLKVRVVVLITSFWRRANYQVLVILFLWRNYHTICIRTLDLRISVPSWMVIQEGGFPDLTGCCHSLKNSHCRKALNSSESVASVANMKINLSELVTSSLRGVLGCCLFKGTRLSWS